MMAVVVHDQHAVSLAMTFETALRSWKVPQRGGDLIEAKA
jgi:hypothetical protein